MMALAPSSTIAFVFRIGVALGSMWLGLPVAAQEPSFRAAGPPLCAVEVVTEAPASGIPFLMDAGRQLGAKPANRFSIEIEFDLQGHLVVIMGPDSSGSLPVPLQALVRRGEKWSDPVRLIEVGSTAYRPILISGDKGLFLAFDGRFGGDLGVPYGMTWDGDSWSAFRRLGDAMHQALDFGLASHSDEIGVYLIDGREQYRSLLAVPGKESVAKLFFKRLSDPPDQEAERVAQLGWFAITLMAPVRGSQIPEVVLFRDADRRSDVVGHVYDRTSHNDLFLSKRRAAGWSSWRRLLSSATGAYPERLSSLVALRDDAGVLNVVYGSDPIGGTLSRLHFGSKIRLLRLTDQRGPTVVTLARGVSLEPGIHQDRLIRSVSLSDGRLGILYRAQVERLDSVESGWRPLHSRGGPLYYFVTDGERCLESRLVADRAMEESFDLAVGPEGEVNVVWLEVESERARVMHGVLHDIEEEASYDRPRSRPQPDPTM